MPSIIGKVIDSLTTYKQLLRGQGYSKQEISTLLLSLLNPHPNDRVIRSSEGRDKDETDAQNTADEGKQSEEASMEAQAFKSVVTQYLKTYKSISEGLNELVVEIEYRVSLLQQNIQNASNIFSQEAFDKINQLKNLDSQKTVKDRKEEKQKREKKKKNPLRAVKKDDKIKVRAIEQLKLQAQNDTSSNQTSRTEHSLAQIKALQQYLKVKILAGQNMMKENWGQSWEQIQQISAIPFGQSVVVYTL